ncbi:MAG: hypothetical protein WD400_01940, partial [Pontimonas sp.]
MGLKGQVDSEVHVVDACAQFSPLMVIAGGKVSHQMLELVAAERQGDETSVQTDLATDANEGGPPS